MCMSILPRRVSAGSSMSTRLVVKMMTRSPPLADHSPSTKLSRPESVTLLPSSLLGSSGSQQLPPAPFLSATLRFPARSTSMASMSSMTMMDLPLVSMKSFRSSALFLTDVRSRS
ncbi:hypothetical protein VPH35_131343 [Triticum aestivum]